MSTFPEKTFRPIMKVADHLVDGKTHVVNEA